MVGRLPYRSLKAGPKYGRVWPVGGPLACRVPPLPRVTLRLFYFDPVPLIDRCPDANHRSKELFPPPTASFLCKHVCRGFAVAVERAFGSAISKHFLVVIMIQNGLQDIFVDVSLQRPCETFALAVNDTRDVANHVSSKDLAARRITEKFFDSSLVKFHVGPWKQVLILRRMACTNHRAD